MLSNTVVRLQAEQERKGQEGKCDANFVGLFLVFFKPVKSPLPLSSPVDLEINEIN